MGSLTDSHGIRIVFLDRHQLLRLVVLRYVGDAEAALAQDPPGHIPASQDRPAGKRVRVLGRIENVRPHPAGRADPDGIPQFMETVVTGFHIRELLL